jgi:hypothetical protein
MAGFPSLVMLIDFLQPFLTPWSFDQFGISDNDFTCFRLAKRENVFTESWSQNYTLVIQILIITRHTLEYRAHSGGTLGFYELLATLLHNGPVK